MNAQNTEQKPVVQRETKNKIRGEFERTPLIERLKAKFLSFYFLQKVAIIFIVLNYFFQGKFSREELLRI